MGSVDIDQLVAELEPVRPLRARAGMAVVTVAVLAMIALTAPVFGLRPDVARLAPRDIVLLRSGALLLAGFAAAWAVVRSASPGVGARRDGWRWALAAAALFPLTSLALVLGGTPFPMAVVRASSAPWCLGISLLSAAAIGTALTAWLKRGAVTELRRAGWLTGIASGALGTFVYNLGCPSGSVHYAALWYTLAVGIAALAGRCVVPGVLRW